MAGVGSVIEIWMQGGPCHLDTFDPKGDAPYDCNGGRKAIATDVAGVRVHEWLPELARCASSYTLVRSLTHPYAGHETATYLMQTGRTPGGGDTFPAIGAVTAMMKAKAGAYAGDLPPYVILTGVKGRFSELGFLSESYAPLVTGGNPNAARFAVDGVTPPAGLDASSSAKRFALLGELDSYVAASDGLLAPALRSFVKAGEEAKRIAHGDAAETFDLTRETAATRERYGRTVFGQSLLAARRLVQYGVPYVTVNMPGWDSHKRHFETMERRTREFDRGLAALLGDLRERNLLASTLVWATGEFGRTPRVDWSAPWNGGRNHFPHCFSALVAGGGVPGGRVIGKSDETGSKVVENPVSPVDFLARIYARAGIDRDAVLPNPHGRRLTVLPAKT